MADLPLDVRDDLTGVGLVPAPVQLLGGRAELNDEVAGQVLWLNLAAFFPPQPQQGGLVVAHDDPGVRAADEGTAGMAGPCVHGRTHGFLANRYVIPPAAHTVIWMPDGILDTM